MNEELNSIADELYKLNENFQTFILILAELMGKPLTHLKADGSFEFEKEEKIKNDQ